MDIKKWLFRILWIPVLVIAVLFLIANREPVSISLDPISAAAPSLTTMALPLWAWLYFMLFLGFAVGAVAMWTSGRDGRIKARAERRELKSLRADYEAVSRELASLKNSPATSDLPKIESADV
ncbi:MAG: LapA family protein [Marinicaulis sp.]|nr:LapA family protein [Marinicaulis sp.]